MSFSAAVPRGCQYEPSWRIPLRRPEYCHSGAGHEFESRYVGRFGRPDKWANI